MHMHHAHLHGMGLTTEPRNLPTMMTRLESLTGDAAEAAEGLSPMNEPGTPPRIGRDNFSERLIEGIQRHEDMDAYAPNM